MDFIEVFSWCVKLSWKVSHLYTILRVLAELFNPLLNIAAVFVSRQIINYISASIGNLNTLSIYNFLFLMALIALLKVIMIKV
ncbi:hypothetical protein [Schnuerera sp.]|uniref:hypothetical protein n=1 Tax=Schnuerera sp. TaxID=2794844 RepID=UPI002C8C58EC|nr:hypothetical protein [Schnuerera sp.]HSH34804.1 hypothetical protein [Schnuerera sp.]